MSASLGILIAAAGASRRFGDKPKLLELLQGEPLFCHCLQTFGHAFPEAPIVMAVPAALLERFRTAAFAHLPEAICPRLSFADGGTTRTESINLALKSLLSRTSAPPAFVAVHDAARPYVTADALKKCLGRLEADASLDGALVGRPCTDTVHTVDEAGLVSGTPPRAALCAAETPQVFRTEALLCAYAAYAAKPSLPLPTDEADLVLRSGPRRIAVVMTGEANPKITYATDLP